MAAYACAVCAVYARTRAVVPAATTRGTTLPSETNVQNENVFVDLDSAAPVSALDTASNGSTRSAPGGDVTEGVPGPSSDEYVYLISSGTYKYGSIQYRRHC